MTTTLPNLAEPEAAQAAPVSAHEAAPADRSPAPTSSPLPADSTNTTAPNPDLPTLSPDSRSLLIRLAALHDSLFALAAETHRDVLDLILWADSPDIAPWRARFRAERAASRHELCCATLESLIHQSTNPIEKRHASTTLIRHASPTARSLSPRTTTPRRAAALQEAASSSTPSPAPATRTPTRHPPEPTRAELFSSAPAAAPAADRIETPPEQPIPDPAHSPDTVADIILAAIREPEPAAPTAAILLHNFHHTRARLRHHAAPAGTATLLRAQTPLAFQIEAIEPAKVLSSAHDWAAREHIISIRGKPLTLRINLHRPSWGPLANCWLLFNLSIRPANTPYSPYDPPTHPRCNSP